MPNEVEPVEQIHITSSVARWLMETCVALVRHYLGREFDPAIGTFTDRNKAISALDDRVPVEDHEFRYWTSNVINLVTTIAGILHQALSVGALMRMRIGDIDGPPDSSLTDSGEGEI